jgi:hypothetical protein
MRSKAEALAKPTVGDRWRMSFKEEYRITAVKNGYVYDECTKGIDAGQGELSNPIGLWQVWASAKNAEYLGGAK